jgi:hypothetical protein
MAVSAVLTRLVYIPGWHLIFLYKLLRVGIERYSLMVFRFQRWDAIEEEG